jgi:peptidoglycan/xylan/chitin deacetylase (PgdA/CDA1 family)
MCGMRRASTRVVQAAALMAGVQYGPSVLTLGAWGSLRALPFDLCRWQGPRGGPTAAGSADDRAVALTFDDGPDPDSTPLVLDRLDQLGLVATFFCLGWRVEQSPGLVAEILRRGHQVETHGYRHGHHLGHGPGWVADDLRKAKDAMAASGLEPTWYRPTYGQLTGSTLWMARRLGWRLVLWSAWGREWATTDPHAVVDRVDRRLRPGAIVLLHDSDHYGPPGMARVALEALEPLAERLAARGLGARTLDGLCPVAAAKRGAVPGVG